MKPHEAASSLRRDTPAFTDTEQMTGQGAEACLPHSNNTTPLLPGVSPPTTEQTTALGVEGNMSKSTQPQGVYWRNGMYSGFHLERCSEQ